jgi:large subunit ribosomal protein L25
MSTILLEAESRKDIGKGASRRLRRLENKVPAIIYGGKKKPMSLTLLHNKVIKALENQSIYSSVFEISVDGKAEQVILKDIQRHPYKPIIMHMDLQRVSDKDVLVKNVPLQFINEEACQALKEGGVVSHTMIQVEVRCEARNLPEFIEVDIANMELNQVLHLSDLVLPKGVELTVDLEKDASHDLPVVSVHLPKVIHIEEEVVEEAAAEEEVEEGAAEEAPAAEDKGATDEEAPTE